MRPFDICDTMCLICYSCTRQHIFMRKKNTMVDLYSCHELSHLRPQSLANDAETFRMIYRSLSVRSVEIILTEAGENLSGISANGGIRTTCEQWAFLITKTSLRSQKLKMLRNCGKTFRWETSLNKLTNYRPQAVDVQQCRLISSLQRNKCLASDSVLQSGECATIAKSFVECIKFKTLSGLWMPRNWGQETNRLIDLSQCQ